ncbi:MAG: T9SS type A sorting domain-containing protein [Bacteroidetes bacterium]|nr:T9SS type A sorting domain-containing protein [Bacteroidota bacterium]
MNLLEPNTGTFYLFNTLGELLINTEISGQQNLNIQNIASGIYSFRLICKDGSVVTGKIVIQQ